jgi:hypothetical protein
MDTEFNYNEWQVENDRRNALRLDRKKKKQDREAMNRIRWNKCIGACMSFCYSILSICIWYYVRNLGRSDYYYFFLLGVLFH